MGNSAIDALGPFLLSLVLVIGAISFGVLIVRGLFEAIKGLITQSTDD